MLGARALGADGLMYWILLGFSLLGSVVTAVHHTEVIAHRIGEPFGTLVLAITITLIEVALIVSLMISAGGETTTLARDTVFASIMLIMTGLTGLCLLIGGRHHREQTFRLDGVSAALATLATITALTLVFPNFTVTATGPLYSASQLGVVAVVSLLLYGTFIFVQTVRHRDYFLPSGASSDHDAHAAPPSNKVTFLSAGVLAVSLIIVVATAEILAPHIESAVLLMHAPKELVGVIISSIVLMPEGYAAIRAARRNRLQTSLNLTLGSALASIGFTIPAIAIISLFNGWSLSLGLPPKETVLLALALFVSTLSLNTGRTTVLQGAVHLGIFLVYVFTVIVP
jgi:Ca2+:H+ antiporter